ncbi:F-box domain-containing protein [Favolaschia claudopus]|uniref:F-box domain-containing protein n=1 Tax=Favolaschia claudopus TaxID=2862362 RepID=A0AAW0A6Z0_9AGAR
MSPVNQYINIDSPTSRYALRARLAAIDSEIEELHARIKDLETARKPVANALGAIVYPILTLPVEITSEIFAHYFNEVLFEVDGLALCHLHTARDESDGPLILSQVCRAWRTIAINTPSLWCRVRAAAYNSPRPEWRELFECWLSRAGNRMLYLDLAGDSRHSTTLLPAVVPYSSQWRVFKFRMVYHDWATISNLVETARGRIPNLREFSVRWQGPNDHPTKTPITAFSDAPKLRKVALYWLSSEKIVLPWAQLTSLTLSGHRVADGITILHLTSSLEELSIDLFGPASGEIQPVVLDRVHKLLLPNVFECLTSFPYLTLPGLRTFEISRMLTEEDVEALTMFLERSPCLDSVSITCEKPDLVISALASIGNAGEITLPTPDWSFTDLKRLFVRIASDHTFLPNMRSLQLPLCTSGIPYEELLDILLSRSSTRGGLLKLESFRLIQWADRSGPDPAIADKLRALMDEGLDIHIEGFDEMGNTEKISLL